MKKKILFFLSTMNIGGVEKSFLSLLAEFPDDKYEITLMLLERKGGFLGLVPSWVKIEEAEWFSDIKPVIMNPPQETIKRYWGKRQVLKILTFILNYYRSKNKNDRSIYYREVFKEIPWKEESYDLAVAYAGPTEIIDYFILNRVKATKKIGWMHFDASEINMNKKLYRYIYSKFYKVFTVSECATKKLIEKLDIPEEKVSTFKNIISHKMINELSSESVIEEFGESSLKIITLGRLSLEKGQDIGIKVLKRLVDDGLDVKWYCVGEGKERKYYEQLVREYALEERFILLGVKLNPYPYIKMADIYVQTSRHEGYCISLAEARVLKKPIVTTRFTGATEQIEDGKTGLISYAEEEDLYLKIKELIKNEELRKKLEKELSERVFEGNNKLEEFLEILEV